MRGEPAPQLGVQRLDVAPADQVDVGWQCAAWRIKEALVRRIGIGTPDQPQRGDVVRGRHARVRGMKLIGPPPPLELGANLIDSLGDDEHGAGGGLRQEIAQRPLQAAGQDDAIAVVRDERERAVDRQHAGWIRGEQRPVRTLEVTGPQMLCGVRNQVDDLRDVLVHGRAGRMRIACPPPGASAIRSTELRVTGRCEMATAVGLVSQLAPGPSA